MAASVKKCKKVLKRYNELRKNNDETHSLHELAVETGLSAETLNRYMRKARNSGDKVDTRPEYLPKVLIFDIETSPIISYTWGLWNQNVGLNQIKEDWYVISYAAKWLGVDGVMYKDLRGEMDGEKNHKDRDLLRGIWQLLDEADVVITQNGIKFDSKKLNARFVINGYAPPSHYKHIDTLKIAKSTFGFTSNKLEYMTFKLCTKYKKQVKRKFDGFMLWKECLADNFEAWKCMENYNKYDVLSLEELYYILAPWYKKHPNLAFLAGITDRHVCHCGSEKFTRNGYAYTQVSKFQKYKCKSCGTESRGRVNMLEKDERQNIRMYISQ